jgi:hypothetical protein
MELIATLGQRNGLHIFKEQKPDVSEALIKSHQSCTGKEAVPKSCSFQIQSDPYSTALQNYKNQ